MSATLLLLQAKQKEVDTAETNYNAKVAAKVKAEATNPLVEQNIKTATKEAKELKEKLDSLKLELKQANITHRKAEIKENEAILNTESKDLEQFNDGTGKPNELDLKKAKIRTLERDLLQKVQALEDFMTDTSKKTVQPFDNNVNESSFRYRNNPLLNSQVGKDLDYIDNRWEEVKKAKVDDDAKRTNNWSLIWKLKSIQKELNRIIRELKNKRNQIVIDNGLDKATQEQKDALAQASEEELDDLYKQWLEKKASISKSYFIRAVKSSARGVTTVASAVGTAAYGTGSWIKSFFVTPAASKVETSEGIDSGLQFKDITTRQDLNFLTARSELIQDKIDTVTEQLSNMFTEMKRWISVCGGQIYIPEKAPEFKGLEHLASRISEWFVWPQLQPSLFPLQRQVVLYGPAKSGKTVLANLAAFEAAKKLKDAFEKSSNERTTINSFAVVYLVDAEKLKSDKVEVAETRLRNYFNCLQYEVSQLKESNSKIEPMAILILDNVDALFEEAANVKAGGDGNGTDMFLTILNPNRLETEWPNVRIIWSMKYPWKIPKSIMPPNYQKYSLFVDLPSIPTRRSIVELAIQNDMSENIANYLDQEYSYEQVIENNSGLKDKYSNVIKLDTDRPCLNSKQTLCIVQEDDNLFGKEKEIRESIKSKFLGERNKKSTFDRTKAALTDLIFGKSFIPLGGLRGKQIVNKLLFETPEVNVKNLVEQYMQMMSSTIEFLVNATGMSLEGYCKLQTDSGLTHSEVDMFMTVTRRDSLLGRTPFGFTIQDLVQFYGILKQSVSTKQLSRALNETNSYIVGYEKFHSQACKSKALDSKILTINEPDCEQGLGTDLMSDKDHTPVLALSARFGSHRFLKEDVMKALNSFEKYVKPKTDYPEFVTYVLLKVPKTNRTSINPKDISEKCRIQPGPSTRASQITMGAAMGETFVDPAYLATWTPTQRIAGSAKPAQQQLSKAAILRRRKLSKLLSEK